MGDVDVVALQSELERLRAENASLRQTAPLTGTGQAAGTPRRAGWWRGLLSAVCIVLAAILVPLSIAGTWTRAQLVDEDSFVSTFAPLAEDPDVQALVIDQATVAINDAIDVEGLTNDLFDGIESLDLPPAAATALDLLRAPAASGVQSLIQSSVATIVESDAFAEVWRQALIASHRALVATAAGGTESGSVTIAADGTVGIQLAPIIAELKSALVEQGFGIASSIPEIDQTIVIVQSDSLLLVGTIYNLAATVGWWLPLIALALFAAGILLARRTSTAVLGSGVGIAAGAGVLSLLLYGAGAVLGMNASAIGVPSRTLDSIYSTVVGDMRDTAAVFIFFGIVVVLAAWLGGRWSSARRVRGFTANLTTSARHWLQARGLHTGAFGDWLHRQRRLVRVILLALTLVVLFLTRPLSLGTIIGTTAVALLLWLAAVLLEEAPEERPIAEAAAAEAEAAAAAAEDADPTAVVVPIAPRRDDVDADAAPEPAGTASADGPTGR